MLGQMQPPETNAQIHRKATRTLRATPVLKEEKISMHTDMMLYP